MKINIETIKEQLEEEINTLLSEKFLRSNNFFYDKLNEVDFAFLLKPVKYIIASGGKRWRAILAILCFYIFDKKNRLESENDIFKLASIIEFIHTASLIHDDIEDSSELRRGKPSTHIEFGLDTALNSGSWLYFHAINILQSIQIPNEKKYFINQIIVQGIYNLHLGQALDISWHRDKDFFPTIELYEKMIKLKTGTLAELAGVIGVFCASSDIKKSQAVSDAFYELGVAFQIFDDIKNITVGIAGKDKGDDIVEGKKSLPVIFFVQKSPEKKEKLSACFDKAKAEGIKSEAIQEAINLLYSNDCIDLAKNYADEKISKAKSSLKTIFKDDKSLETLLSYIDTIM